MRSHLPHVRSHGSLSLPVAAALVLVAGTAAAGPAAAPSGAPRLDCSYAAAGTQPAAGGAGPLVGTLFPADDLFRPLLADPKQPRFFASYQRVRSRTTGAGTDAGIVGFGEEFGLWGLRQRGGCDGVQVGLSAGVFSQFDLDAPSSDLVNSDFLIGLPVTLRRGLLSARLRVFHQSSHLGDEFLLSNPEIERVNLSFEAADALVSIEYRWVRVYAGGGYLLHREPAVERGTLQWGVELRLPDRGVPRLVGALGAVRVVPVLAADFKAFEEFGWAVTASVTGGVELAGPESGRRLRLLLLYLRGRSPYGQFFDQKIESIGVGISFAF